MPERTGLKTSSPASRAGTTKFTRLISSSTKETPVSAACVSRHADTRCALTASSMASRRADVLANETHCRSKRHEDAGYNVFAIEAMFTRAEGRHR